MGAPGTKRPCSSPDSLLREGTEGHADSHDRAATRVQSGEANGIYTRHVARPAGTALVIALMLAAQAPSMEAASRPTKAQIESQTRAAVVRSRARLITLRVIPPNLVYVLKVGASHPAAYLRYRLDPLVRLMNRLTRVEWNFERFYFAVFDRLGERGFWVRRERSGKGELWRWNVRPDLADCARNLDFDVEIDPEHTAPPCRR